MRVRKYANRDVPAMIDIWNEVIEEGMSFPQEEPLDARGGEDFFAAQTYCGIAVDFGGNIHGLYTLHPNNEGRCGHIANASFAVRSSSRNQKAGQDLVNDCLKVAKEKGFTIMQFNAVVENNEPARHIYEKLGFKELGTIPGGFKLKDGSFANIVQYYREL